MANSCGSSILACGLRATLLDSLGSVSEDENNSYVTDKLIEISTDPEIEAGSDRTLKSGCDCIVATYRGPDFLKRFNLEFNLATLEPGLISMLTGGPVILDGADIIGVNWPTGLACGTTPPPFVALEVWSYNWDFDQQNDERPYLHWVWTMSRWQVGPSRLNSDFAGNVLRGFTSANTQWGHGPYGDGPDDPIGALGAVFQTDVAPPEAACAYAHAVPSS